MSFRSPQWVRVPRWLVVTGCFLLLLGAAWLWVNRWPRYDLSKVSPELRAVPTGAKTARSDIIMDGGSRWFVFTYANGSRRAIMAVIIPGRSGFGPESFSRLAVYSTGDLSAEADEGIGLSPDNLGYLGELIRSATDNAPGKPPPGMKGVPSGPVEDFRVVSRDSWEMWPYMVVSHFDQFAHASGEWCRNLWK